MKIRNRAITYFLLTWLIFANACDFSLNEEVYSDLSSTNFYKTEKELDAALFGIYKGFLNTGWDMFAPAGNSSIAYIINQSCDQFFLSESWGGLDPAQYPGKFHWFQWTSDQPTWLFDIYNACYNYIAATNLLLQKIPESNVSDDLKKQFTAESKALRAMYYSVLLSFYGNVPIVDKFEVSINFKPEQSTADQIAKFIETNLLEAIPDLLDQNYVGTSKYGRINKVAAQAVLAKLYLNTKQWKNTSDVCDSILSNKNYGLATEYSWIFDWDNNLSDKAKEMLVVVPCGHDVNTGNNWAVHVVPWTWPGVNGWNGYWAYRSFYNTFDSADTRKARLLTKWTDTDGIEHQLPSDRCLPLKYQIDPNFNDVRYMDNDVPIIRMADIYLAKAEALNELNGPNQLTIDLINAVRKRAFEPDKPIDISAFASKELLRDHILKERGWELWCEAGIRREDLIRQGKFIQQARDRGIDAKDYHVFYPIARTELELNPKLHQNDGYTN